ncbi:MAG: glycosyltransferase [Deltaproteobacteria bacterium]|nr:MAG: glycosyltransferase [Deltaproteobacteria bacterium]
MGTGMHTVSKTMFSTEVPVLHLVSRFWIGGAERQFVERLRRHPPGFRAVVGCLEVSGPLLEPVRRMGYEPEVFPLKGSMLQANTAVQIARMAALIRAEGIRIVHATDFNTNLLGLAAARVARVKAIVSRLDLGHLRAGFSTWHRKAEMMSSRLADLVVANAEAVREVCIREEGVRPENCVVVRNGIDLTLVEAVARLPPELHQVRFLCAGEGPEGEYLTDRIAQLGLGERVFLLGHRLDVPAILARCQAACLCSSAEGLSNALMEAMASRLPIVATRVGGNPELVREGENGFLIPYGDAQALAEALRALLSAPEQAREMGLRGRRRVESALSMEKMAEGHGALYRRALGGAPVVREPQLRAA